MIAFQGNRGVSAGLGCGKGCRVRGRTDAGSRKVLSGREAESSHGLKKFRELNLKWGEGAAGVVVPGGYG